MKQSVKGFSGIISVWLVLSATFVPEPAAGAYAPSKYALPKILTGTLYAATSNKQRVLYKFKREATRAGNTVTAVREFTTPEGQLVARNRRVRARQPCVL